MTLGVVLAASCLFRTLRESLAPVALALVIALGYGHLLGAAVSARGRLRERLAPGASPDLVARFTAICVLALFAAYTALAGSRVVFMGLFLLSVWHTIENDLALEDVYGGDLRMRPFTRDLDGHLVAIGLTGLFLVIAVACTRPAELLLLQWTLFRDLASSSWQTAGRVVALGVGVALLVRRPARSRVSWGIALAALAVSIPRRLPPSLAAIELFALVTLYHVVSWLILLLHRARAVSRRSGAREARALLGRLAWNQSTPILASAPLLLAGGELAGVTRVVFSPELYLFLAALHVAQTAAVRGSMRDPS